MQKVNMHEVLCNKNKVYSQDLSNILKYYKWNLVDLMNKMKQKIIKYYN